MNRQEAEIKLKNTFNLSFFYDEQWNAIEKVLNGERVLLIHKTGFGKSLCYQFPATIFDGMTVIFSPLIALMRDQVKKLESLGISAKCINSEQSQQQNEEILQQAKLGKINILYIAPERQENNAWIDAVRDMKLSMVVIDEAHCISVWGHDFRPAFRRIIDLVKLLPKGLPVLATTATATVKVEQDIAEQMGGSINISRGTLIRENFQLYVIRVKNEDEKLIWLGQNVSSLEGSGIIYTGTRANTEIYTKWLEYLGLSVIGYNAGMDSVSRIEVEEGLLKNKWKSVISTNALGMGIDKPDLRFIIHQQIPQSPIHYYQEIGRAGRDGAPAKIILFYCPDDKDLPQAFIDGGRPEVVKYQKVLEELKLNMLGRNDIMKRTNLRQTPVGVILADLVDQGIIFKNSGGKYELKPDSPPLNTKRFEDLRNWKREELAKIIEYAESRMPRMKFLCDYLGDKTSDSFKNCDNTGLVKFTFTTSEGWLEKLNDFRESYFPTLEVENAKTNLVNGVAASYYGVSNVGVALHRSKYETKEDFPDFLLKLCLRAFRNKFAKETFDLVVYVPPTDSGDLVKNFAVKLASLLKFPISHELIKNRNTKEQKIFQNGLLKSENIKNAFTFTNPSIIKGKNILLIDDIFDSGATVKEIGKYFTNLGATKIAPLTIAKTMGGDLT